MSMKFAYVPVENPLYYIGTLGHCINNIMLMCVYLYNIKFINCIDICSKMLYVYWPTGINNVHSHCVITTRKRKGIKKENKRSIYGKLRSITLEVKKYIQYKSVLFTPWCTLSDRIYFFSCFECIVKTITSF